MKMQYNVSFEACAALMLTVFTVFVRISNPLKKPQNTAYINMSICVILSCVFDIAASLLINAASDGVKVPLVLSYVTNILFFIMFVFDGYYYCVYLYTLIKEGNFRQTIVFRILGIPISLFIIFTVSTPWTHLLFYFDENGSYTFGSMHYMATVFMSIYIVAGIVFLCINRKKITRLQFLSGQVFIVTAAVGLYIQNMFFPSVCIGFAAAAMSVIMVYFALQTPDSYALMRALDELKIAKEKAEAASAAKEEFLTHMSHEIRTPINSILGMSEMIIRKSDDEEVISYAKVAQKSEKQLLNLVNNVLDYTKLNSGEIVIADSEFSVKEVFNSVISEAHIKLDGHETVLATDIDKNIPCKLFGDEVRLKQIIRNIISNAVKYTEQGKITLSAFSEPMGESHVKLSVFVSDTGCGIEEEDTKKIFDSFVRIENEKNIGIEGAGLGLAVTAKLLEMMDSKIEVKSEYGKGSVFSFGLILRVADSVPVGSIGKEDETDLAETIEGKELYAPDAKILAVDDSEVNLFVIKEILKQFGIRADVANGGESCFEQASQMKYDIIFLDHMMPAPDGMKTMHMIKETSGCESRNTPIVVLTANAVVGARENYLAEGFDDYLSKPVSFKNISEVLEKYLPKELISYKAGSAQSGDTSEIFKEIKLSHIDTSVGIKYISGKSDTDIEKQSEQANSDNSVKVLNKYYINMLNLYANQATEYLESLEEDMRNRNMENYAIVAHALKSSSRSIGAAELADIAQLQEMFAKSGNYDEVSSLHGEFIKGIKETVAEAEKICRKTVSDKKTAAPEISRQLDKAELLAILNNGADKLHYYDETAAIQIISELDHASYNGESCFNIAEKVRRKIENFDMDGALEYIENVIIELKDN